MKLIAYLSNGYPSLDDSLRRGIDYVGAGVDIIEADIPSHDPYLDSDYLKKRILSALDREPDYEKYMASLLELKKAVPDAGFMVNIYVETLAGIGVDRFSAFMNDLGEKEVLLVGPEFKGLRSELETLGFYASSFVTREMCEEDLELASRSNGFIYLEGFNDNKKYNQEYPELKDCVAKVREIIGYKRNIYVGIGVHTPERLAEVRESGADGAFLGSMVLKKENDKEEQLKFLRHLRLIADGALH